MSNSIKAILALGLVAVVAGCGQQEEEVVYVEEPVVVEQPTTKY